MHGRARGRVQGMKHFELFHRYELKYLARVHEVPKQGSPQYTSLSPKAGESLSKLAFIHPIPPALFTKCAFIADNAFLPHPDGRANGRTADGRARHR